MKTEHAAVAAIIRKELRRLGITGTVKSRVGAVNVATWNISPVVVREIEGFCSRYRMGHFDPTDDSYRHDNRDDSIPQVPYLFVTTHFGDDLAAQWREWHGGMAWLFDPWTGRRRDARDVGSDVHGLLIVPAGTLGMGMGGGCSEKDNVACA